MDRPHRRPCGLPKASRCSARPRESGIAVLSAIVHPVSLRASAALSQDVTTTGCQGTIKAHVRELHPVAHLWTCKFTRCLHSVSTRCVNRQGFPGDESLIVRQLQHWGALWLASSDTKVARVTSLTACSSWSSSVPAFIAAMALPDAADAQPRYDAEAHCQQMAGLGGNFPISLRDLCDSTVTKSLA